jgi:hypothetical protein
VAIASNAPSEFDPNAVVLACLDTFIIDNSMRRDRPWLGAWRVSKPRLYDRSTFMVYNRSEVDRVR